MTEKKFQMMLFMTQSIISKDKRTNKQQIINDLRKKSIYIVDILFNALGKIELILF